jgi:acetate kinase
VIAVFDTAFHQTLPPVAYTYALPVELSAQYKLRRYGFHGISHAYVSARLIELLGRGAQGTKIIACHLGSGASVCAVRDGQSIDTSMGLTPLEGLVMGTRSGDVDPGLVLYLIRTAGMSANEVDSLLNNQSGLRGLSGLSADVRDLEQAERAGDKNAELALEVFAYHARKYIGAYLAAMNGADAIIFTGGIGENSPAVRAAICAGLSWLGIELDPERNSAHTAAREGPISADSSRVAVYVIPTNEELLIARDTVRVVSGTAQRF